MIKSSDDKKSNEKAYNHNIDIPTNKSISQNLQCNAEDLSVLLGNSADLMYREINFGADNGIKAGIFFINELVDKKLIQDTIDGLMQHEKNESTHLINRFDSNLPDLIAASFISAVETKKLTDYESILNHLMDGYSIILFDNFTYGFAINSSGGEKREVTEPTSQPLVRGPKDGFTERLNINISLIRRKIKNCNLWVETKNIGKVSKTNVAIMFINGIVYENVLQEVHKRIEQINIDAILEGNYIEELIKENQYSPFPTISNTERPDVVAAALLEGRIAILVDGTPFVLIVPTLFIQLFHTPEDYYQSFDISSLTRLLRLVSFFIALLAPSIYIAIITFHHEFIPSSLLLNLAAQRSRIPFPAFIEALIMEIMFEILREAGVRMPKTIGQTISIVGALVLGEAAVQAGLASPAMVIIVSITAMTNFVIPAFNLAISLRILRFVFMLVAASFGIFGITVGLIFMIFHLCSLKSFGVDYMAPFAPYNQADFKDSFLRFPIWNLLTRPKLAKQDNRIRQRTPSTKKDS